MRLGTIDGSDVLEAVSLVVGVEARVGAPAVEPKPVVPALLGLVGGSLHGGCAIALAVLRAGHP